ncbi:uncharacterized protein V6R79_013518 [Siganus canaliculatus]
MCLWCVQGPRVNVMQLMNETVKLLRIPPQMSSYADKHQVQHLVQDLVSRLVVHQPEDPISFLIPLLRRRSSDGPRVLLLGPPAAGKHTVGRKLSAELRAVHVTMDSLLDDQSEHRVQELPVELLVQLVQQRLNMEDCLDQGWVLEGIPQTRQQALGLQQAGVFPGHVVMLEAPDHVLQERTRGKLVDPVTGEVYHQTFIWPDDATVAERLEKPPGRSEEQRLAAVQRYRREVTGLRSTYQHVLKVVSCDQPHGDVYQQVLAFVRTHRCCRTPRILLLGPPGSGKSLQARLLAEKYRMVEVCCGRLLRSAAADGSGLGREIQPYLDSHRPVPDHLLLQALDERLSRVDSTCRGWVLHGFPQDLQQAKGLQESQHQPNRVFFLELTDEVCLERISLRATDPVSGERSVDQEDLSPPRPGSGLY